MFFLPKIFATKESISLLELEKLSHLYSKPSWVKAKPILEKIYRNYLPKTKVKIYFDNDISALSGQNPIYACFSMAALIEIKDLTKYSPGYDFSDSDIKNFIEKGFKSAIFFPIAPYFEGLKKFDYGRGTSLGVIGYFGKNDKFFQEFKDKEIYKKTRFLRHFLDPKVINLMQSMTHQLKGTMNMVASQLRNFEKEYPEAKSLIEMKRYIDIFYKDINYFLGKKTDGTNLFLLNELFEDIENNIFLNKEDIQIKYSNMEIDNSITLHHDRAEVRQILISIVQNAIDAVTEKKINSEGSFNGEVEILVEKEASYNTPSTLTVIIIDNGNGMSQERIELIKNKIISTSKKDGTGIGLAEIAIPLLEKNKIDYSIESSEGQGTKFKLIFSKYM